MLTEQNRTTNVDAMVNLYREVMGLEISHQEPGFIVNAWNHFRAPDEFIYELAYTLNHPAR